MEDAKSARIHKAVTQSKKKFKNRPVLPRTAGLTTLSQMTEKLTKAGLDPSRIVERAQMIAKARGVDKKRKRDEEMDLDESGDEGDAMEVDEEDSTRKRRKTAAGAVEIVNYGKRVPKSDRATIGMRDSAVRIWLLEKPSFC